MSTQVRRNVASSVASGTGSRVGGTRAHLGLQRALAGRVVPDVLQRGDQVGPARDLHGHGQAPAQRPGPLARTRRSRRPPRSAWRRGRAGRGPAPPRPGRCRAGPRARRPAVRPGGRPAARRPRRRARAAGRPGRPTARDRRARCSSTARGRGARPGGNTAASSTSPRKSARSAGSAARAGAGSCGVIDMTGRLLDAGCTVTPASAERTRRGDRERHGALPADRARPAQAAHPAPRRPRAALYYEELMGEEGFSSDSSLLYHRNLPSRDRRRPRLGAARPVDHAEPPADAAAPEAARPLPRRGRRRVGSTS